jgi:hypothetical protein
MKSKVCWKDMPRLLVNSTDVSKDSFVGLFNSTNSVIYQKTWYFFCTVTVVFVLSFV